MTDAELQAIRDRVEKATPSPWVTVDRPMAIAIALSDFERSRCVYAVCGSQYGLIPQGILFIDDAEFVAHAREDIPALLAELAAVPSREMAQVYLMALQFAALVFADGGVLAPDAKQAMDTVQAYLNGRAVQP